jgi:hypothetical protein
MRTMVRWQAGLLCFAVLLSGCGGGAAPAAPTPTPPPAITYENVAGTWTGHVGGVSQGVTLDGTITLNVQQSSGVLAGGYAVDATLTNPTQQTTLKGEVTLTGTLASGANPSVNITTRSVPCPNLPAENWSGSYGSTNRVLTITGTAHVISSPACAIVLSYPQTITLTR